jgi:hypothetical protein
MSLQYLERLLLRTSRSLKETPRSEDRLVRQWTIHSPPKLKELLLWTKAFKGGINGERMVKWFREGTDCRWRKTFDQPGVGGRVDDGAFV